jgi:glucose/arabinose dehydrogenase
VVLASLGLAVYVRRNRRECAAALAAAAVGAVAFLITAGATIDASWTNFVEIEGNDYMSRLGSALLFGSAVALGAVVAVAGVVGAKLVSDRKPRALGAIMVAVPVVTVIATVVLLGIVERQTRKFETGPHPSNVRPGDSAAAVLVVDELELPTGIAVTAEGVVFWAENQGFVIGVAVPDGSGGYTSSEFAAMADAGAAEPYHLALHPDWPKQPYVYVSTAYPGEGEELLLGIVRFRNDGLRGEDPVRLVGGLPYGADRHMGTALAFCGEYLYLSVGDNDLPSLNNGLRNFAQDPRAPYGKILRYRIDGIELEPAGVLAQDPPVFAMGFRNVFGMDCTDNSDTLVVADNGPVGHDQIRLVGPGSNHEWPISNERNTLSSPVYTSGPTPIGVTGVAWLNPSELLLATVNPQSVYKIELDEFSNLVEASVYFDVEGPALAITLGADGCTYVADASRIWRIVDEACP